MNQEELDKILGKHRLWLEGKPGGERAILTRANLEGANLEGANLAEANLAEANLAEANLRGANLRGANLEGANLWGAILTGALLTIANLEGANLAEANLAEANLWGAYLERANLTDTTKLPKFQIPQEGILIVWKKLENGLAKLEVPKEAKRTANLTGSKCRAEFVRVLELQNGTSDVDKYTRELVYKVGELVYPDNYNEDIRLECTNGIHFFLTKEEAEEW